MCICGFTMVIAGLWWFGAFPSVKANRDSLRLVVSGDTAGWITPCGCASNQSGGLLRRGSYVLRLRTEAEVLLAEVGGAPHGTSPYQRVKFEAILAGEMAMGIAAHNLGGPEAAMGTDYLREVQSRTGVPFVSANLRDAKGKPVTATMRIVEVAGRRIALTGVLSRRYARQTDGIIDDPHDALLAQLSSPAEPYDALVVLAYLPEDELVPLAEALPEADIVVGGPTGQSLPPRQVGPTLLASATNKGKFLVEFEASCIGQGNPWSARIVEMNEAWPDDEVQRTNLEHFHAVLARHDFSADKTGLARWLPDNVPETFAIAGTASCRTCHERDSAAWDRSKHAQAWHTLETRGSHVDPSCQVCHTTGYGLPGGFVSAGRSTEKGAVGCENCHGPSLAHAREPTLRTPYDARDQCGQCHDRENSPQFDYAAYWPLIKHGEHSGESAPRPAPAGVSEEARS